MWLTIYPALTLALWALERFGLQQVALPMRTLILTGTLVPTMVYVLIPLMSSTLRMIVTTRLRSLGSRSKYRN